MKKHTILWADDDPDDLALMKEVLKETSEDFEIIEVHDGRRAINYLQQASDRKEFPCLVILDMNMPVLNGRETLAILKSEPVYATIPIVVFTTSSSELDRMFCRRFGVEMITKPPTYLSLKDVARKLLSFCTFSIDTGHK